MNKLKRLALLMMALSVTATYGAVPLSAVAEEETGIQIQSETTLDRAFSLFVSEKLLAEIESGKQAIEVVVFYKNLDYSGIIQKVTQKGEEYRQSLNPEVYTPDEINEMTGEFKNKLNAELVESALNAYRKEICESLGIAMEDADFSGGGNSMVCTLTPEQIMTATKSDWFSRKIILESEIVTAEELGYEAVLADGDSTESAKDWNYYASLDDYSVYCEYCTAHGYEIQEELPSREELPDYNALHYGVKSGSTLVHAGFEFILANDVSFPNEKYNEVRYNMDYFGFPQEWFPNVEDASIYITNYGGNIYIQFYETEYTKNLTDDVINAYRVVLTVENSQFSQEYPIVYAEISKPIGNQVAGDIDGSGEVNIVDVLALNQYLLGVYEPDNAGISSADVNHDGNVDDADSMMLLKSLVGLETLE